MRLTPTQERTVDALASGIAHHGPFVLFQLSGPEGMGKSTIVDFLRQKIGADAFAVVTDRMANDRLLEAIDAARAKTQGIVADSPLPDYTGFSQELEKREMRLETVPISPFGKDDYLAMAAAQGCALTERDLHLLEHFSLGIPFVASRILEEGIPIDPARATLHLTAYACSIDRPEGRNGVYASRLLEKYLGKQLPEEVLSSPLFDTNGVLGSTHVDHIPHGMPRCPHTLAVYNEWIKRALTVRETHDLSIFVPAVPDPATLSKELGLRPEYFATNRGNGITPDSRLKKISAGMRKFAIGLGNAFLCTEYYEDAAAFYDKELRQHGIGSCAWKEYGDGRGYRPLRVMLPNGGTPFFLYSTAHRGEMQNQPQLGLGTQSLLEHLGLPFRLQLGTWKAFDYDPEQNALNEVEVTKTEQD